MARYATKMQRAGRFAGWSWLPLVILLGCAPSTTSRQSPPAAESGSGGERAGSGASGGGSGTGGEGAGSGASGGGSGTGGMGASGTGGEGAGMGASGGGSGTGGMGASGGASGTGGMGASGGASGTGGMGASSGAGGDPLYQPPGCPRDYSGPIPTPVCTDEREPIDEKFTPAQLAHLEAAAAAGPVDVLILVSGGGTICPGAERHSERLEAENLASQACVRELIASLGGTSSPDSYWMGNIFDAQLTWEQIQIVGSYPERQDYRGE